jgi:hypothetical protein
MFYLCTCRGFTNIRRSMYIFCAVLFLSGLLVGVYGIYAAVLNAREFSFFDPKIVNAITIMAVVQVQYYIAHMPILRVTVSTTSSAPLTL